MDRLGTQPFLAAYSLIMVAVLVWLLLAYAAAPHIIWWTPPLWLHWVPILVMPVALLLAVCGLTTPSPTVVGGEKIAEAGSGDPAPGMLRVTRHPFLWGGALWAAAHLAANGDMANLILMAGILVLCLGGMWHIDQRREAALGGAWGPIALTTSTIPLRALLEGRAKMDWPGIGWWRPVLALALYVVVLALHEAMFGVSALP